MKKEFEAIKLRKPNREYINILILGIRIATVVRLGFLYRSRDLYIITRTLIYFVKFHALLLA